MSSPQLVRWRSHGRDVRRSAGAIGSGWPSSARHAQRAMPIQMYRRSEMHSKRNRIRARSSAQSLLAFVLGAIVMDSRGSQGLTIGISPALSGRWVNYTPATTKPPMHSDRKERANREHDRVRRRQRGLSIVLSCSCPLSDYSQGNHCNYAGLVEGRKEAAGLWTLSWAEVCSCAALNPYT